MRSSSADKLECVADAMYFAKRRLPKFLYQRYENGTGLALTLENNQKAFQDVAFLPRAAVQFPNIELKTTILGSEISMPIVLGPVGGLRTGAPGQGELAVARVAGPAGVIQTVSTFTGYTIEEITSVATGPIWYQLFYVGSKKRAEVMVDRARRSGCTALVLTADIASPNRIRERPYRQRAHSPLGYSPRDLALTAPQMITHLPWLLDFLRDGRPANTPMVLRDDGTPLGVPEAIEQQLVKLATWEDISWLRSLWDGPIVVKGIMTADDAQRARDLGVDGIVVSNHGGNHLDGGAPTLEVLPWIADAVKGEIEIYIDGGIRRGSDVVKALALGASAVMLGRAYVFPLLAAGEAGVRRILEIFRYEITDTLAAIGCASVHSVDASYVRTPATWNLGMKGAGHG
jgi:isopentenyl diphosphate isomerase/L-lactate dehydrogenase-like FMN-dependent dehydrogenase